jgi:predicted alpha/beta superfamily hydrolase
MVLKKTTLLFSIILFISLNVVLSITITITKLPSYHPYNDSVYIAGDFNNWNPADPALKLLLNKDSTYSITFGIAGNINYKFTRGSWDKVEKGNNCAEIQNRTYTLGEDTSIKAQIVNWADKCGTGSHTSAKNVLVISDTFFIPQLDRKRRIWLYLPPNYQNTLNHYPVLYMHDGQNLFDNYYSFAGEWGIDESLNSLFNSGDNGCIVVGIDNGGDERINEYSPWYNPEYGGGAGEKYINFLVETLKPYIDSNYRTLSDRENTAIMGSSVGGLISFYAGLAYPNIFSKIGIFSPSFWFTDSCYLMARKTPKQFDLKMYFLAGGKESSSINVIKDCEDMIDSLKLSGYTNDELLMVSKADGQHSEWFWKREFPAAYKWLFNLTSKISESTNDVFELYPNPVKDYIYISFNHETKNACIEIFNSTGLKVFTGKVNTNAINIDASKFENGIYFVNVCTNNSQNMEKLIISR